MTHYSIPLDQALSRLADTPKIEARFEQRPNSGRTYAYTFDRTDAVGFLSAANPGQIFESGPQGQLTDFGIYVGFVHRLHGDGLLFLQTKPAARVPAEIIRQREMDRLFGHNVPQGTDNAARTGKDAPL